MRFVGRRTELAALRSEAAAAAQGRCRVVLIHGVDGVGKSRLVDEFATLADRDGFRHIRVTGRISADSPPDWPWRQALAALDAPSSWDGASSIAYAEALVAAVGAAPTVVVLDDLHGFDPTSIEVVNHLAETVPRVPLLVLGSYLDGQAPSTVAGPAVTRIALRGLSAAEVGELGAELGYALAEPVIAQLHRRTDGNPHLIREVVGQLEAANARDATIARLPIVWPDRALAQVATRLEALGDVTRQVLAAASVIGREFDLAVLELVMGPRQADVLDALDEAIRGRVVIGRSNEVYAFSRSIDREVLYDGLGVRERARLHDATTEALIAFGAAGGDRAPTVVELAHHLVHAAVLGGSDRLDRAIAYLVGAATIASQHGQVHEAVAHHSGALQLAVRAGWSATSRGRLLVGCAVARLAAGELDAARAALATAARVARQHGDPDLLAAVALGHAPPAGQGLTAAQPDPQLVTALRDSLVDTSALGASVSARLHARLAVELVAQRAIGPVATGSAKERDDAVARHLTAASLAATESGDPRALAEACLAQAIATPSGDGDVRPALHAAMALGDSTLECRARLAQALRALSTGDVQATVRELTAVAGLDGHPFTRWYAAQAAAHRSLLAGKVDEAAQLIDDAAALGRVVAPEAAELTSIVQVACLHEVRGTVGDLAPRLARFARVTPQPAWLPALSALVAAEQGERAVAAALLAEILDDPLPLDHVAALWTFTLLGDTAVALQEAEPVRRVIAALELHRRRWIVHGPAAANAGPVALVLARLHLAVDNGPAAAGALEVAAASVGATVWLPHLRALRAQLLATGSAADREEAVREARAARIAAADRGLHGVVARADAIIGAVAARTGSGLTRREEEVARLAVRGASAREIAELLVIGERTVETHLASIYRKLNVRSRVDLIARFRTPTDPTV